MENSLKRDMSNNLIGGVAAGFSVYSNINVWILRGLFLLLLVSGAGFLIYLIMWIAIPKSINQNIDYMENQFEKKSKRGDNGNIISGVVLITIGGLFLLDRYFPEIDFRDIWPWSLILIGIFLLIKGIKKAN